MGWESLSKKHENIKFVSKTNYVNNKWYDITDGIDVLEDKIMRI